MSHKAEAADVALLANDVVRALHNEPVLIMLVGISLLARVWHRIGCPPIEQYLEEIRERIESHPLPRGFLA